MSELFESDQVVRQCSHCRRRLPLAMFPTTGKRQYMTERCCDCLLLRQREMRRRHFPGIKLGPELGQTTLVASTSTERVACTRCGKLLPIQAFPRRRNGLHLQPCRACTRELRTGRPSSHAEPSLWVEHDESAMRLCIHCNTVLPLMAFPVDTRGQPTGRRCLSCRRARRHKQEQADPETAKRRNHDRHLRRLYGVTLEQYENTLAAQNGGCAICGNPEEAISGINGDQSPRRLSVDHNHVSGRTRGLLCRACNQGLDVFKHNLALLEQAVVYLKMHDEQ